MQFKLTCLTLALAALVVATPAPRNEAASTCPAGKFLQCCQFVISNGPGDGVGCAAVPSSSNCPPPGEAACCSELYPPPNAGIGCVPVEA